MLDKSLSSLLGFSYDVISSLREQITQINKLLFINTHENNIGKGLHLLRILLFVLIWWVWILRQSLNDNVGFKFLKNLVVSEVAEFRQVKNWSLLNDLIVVIVENFNDSLSDEINLLNVTFVADHHSSRGVQSAEHVNDELVGEASLAFIKEMIERLFKFLENSGILNELGLHLWSDLLVERELFNYQVEIVFESLLNILSDIVIQSWLNMERLV